jgi:hypothetical protein
MTSTLSPGANWPSALSFELFAGTGSELGKRDSTVIHCTKDVVWILESKMFTVIISKSFAHWSNNLILDSRENRLALKELSDLIYSVNTCEVSLDFFM